MGDVERCKCGHIPMACIHPYCEKFPMPPPPDADGQMRANAFVMSFDHRLSPRAQEMLRKIADGK